MVEHTAGTCSHQKLNFSGDLVSGIEIANGEFISETLITHKATGLKKKIKTIVGNSNRQVQQTEIKLSQTDLNRIQNHVQKFWKMSYGASEVKAIITLKISTNTDGTVRSVSIFDKTLYQKDKFFRATADAARRAVLDSSPLPLPKGKEKKFQNITMDFNTSFINDY